MGVGAGLYMYDVVVEKFTFAISFADEFLYWIVKAKFHYAIWFEPASNQLRTSSEPAPNQLAQWNLAFSRQTQAVRRTGWFGIVIRTS